MSVRSTKEESKSANNVGGPKEKEVGERIDVAALEEVERSVTFTCLITEKD